ncbi:MAG: tRNA (adenosine(37)-N6)-threonylcarbamoyltransferase complex ATPase subunit type 1 TsaE [Bacteroidales bacterium]|nr:tRNA (adenosine(37)-N6)-threonylcarbamoyltransferase complex ATPase subunit type 1 TsaE [Bacteroidales bacterium]
MEIQIQDIEHLGPAARKFLEALGHRRHVAFNAPMGAGKTTFIAAICRELGMEDEASSPTFSIINEYHPAPEAKDSKMIYHFDFYRIESPEETLDLGLDDYFDSDSLCLMEWPENVADFLPEDVVGVSIRVNDDGSRTIVIPE